MNSCKRLTERNCCQKMRSINSSKLSMKKDQTVKKLEKPMNCNLRFTIGLSAQYQNRGIFNSRKACAFSAINANKSRLIFIFSLFMVNPKFFYYGNLLLTFGQKKGAGIHHTHVRSRPTFNSLWGSLRLGFDSLCTRCHCEERRNAHPRKGGEGEYERCGVQET